MTISRRAIVGYLLSCSLNGSTGLMTGNWRKFQVRALSTSLPDQPSQSAERVFLVVSDMSHQCPPPVQARAHKLRHVFQRILVGQRAQDTPPETRLTSTKTVMLDCLSPFLFPVRNRKYSCTCGSFCSCSPRRRCGSIVPRGAKQKGHHFSKWQMQ